MCQDGEKILPGEKSRQAIMSRRFAIDVPSPADLPRPMPATEAMRHAVELFQTDVDARKTFRIPLAALPTMTSRQQYPLGFRAANERRRAEAAARRASDDTPRTRLGRKSRARYTPEERRARRATLMREMNHERARRVRELQISKAAAAERAKRREYRLDALTDRMKDMRVSLAIEAATPRPRLLEFAARSTQAFRASLKRCTRCARLGRLYPGCAWSSSAGWQIPAARQSLEDPSEQILQLWQGSL